MIQIGKIIKKVPIFRMLGKESIDFIVERLKFRTFTANQTICNIGDPGDEMFIIISGQVKICIYSEDGQNEQVVATLNSGDYFGEMALLTGEPRSASVIAVEDSETFVLQKNDFDVILEKYPSISLSMGKIVSQRLRDTLKRATQTPKTEKIEASQNGPSGHLKDVPLVDLISFCESNSLTGSMTLTSGQKKGQFEFKSGTLEKVAMGGLQDDKALDEMLKWEDGHFEIMVRPLTLEKDENAGTEKSKTILVINNSMVVRKIIERAFRGLGYTVLSARDSRTALETINKTLPDIIVSDIKLSDGESSALIEKVRELGEVPFIFITDSSVKKDYEQKIQNYPQTEITKTHEVSEIVKLVENML